MELTPEIAKMILKPIRESGIPPKYGLEFFSSGFEAVFNILEEEYLQDIIKNNGSSFKFVSASFGGGKTHFTYQFREIAWKNNYATSYVPLSPAHTQFDKLLSVFRAICNNLERPLQESEKINILDHKKPEEIGLVKLIKHWYYKKYQEFDEHDHNTVEQKLNEYSETIRDFDNIYFTKVIRNMFKSLIKGDLDTFENLSVWIENNYDKKIHEEFGLKKIGDADTFRLIKSLSKLLTEHMGYSGLIIFFDEGERHALSTKSKDIQISNLRQVIDACGDQSMPGIMFFYTVPDENEFLQPTGHAYDAIKQRLQKHFTQDHPMFPNISLEKIISNLPDEIERNLVDIGKKLAKLYELSENTKFNDLTLNDSIKNIAKAALDQRFGEVAHKRLFVQSVCEAFDLLVSGKESEINKVLAQNLTKNIGNSMQYSESDKELKEESD
jgi:hypothetical protein